MIRAVLYAIALAALVLVVPLAADAAADDRYAASIAPTAVQPSSTGLYTIELKNHPQSTNSASEGHITIPAGFSVDTVPLATTTCSAAPWTALVDSSTIDLMSIPGAELCPNGKLTVIFSATAPAGEGQYEWTTGLSSSDGAFTLQGAQPAVTVDGSPPSGSLDINNGAAFTGSTAVTLNLHATDSNGSGIVSYRVGNGDDCSSAPFVDPFTAVSPYDDDISHTLTSGDGPKTVCVQYKDAAGNVSPTYTDSITLDTVNPIATVDSGPDNPTNQTNATFTFSSSKSGSSFQCQLDGGTFASCTSPKVYSGLADGQHVFSVRASSLGNTGPPTAYTWTVDTIGPDTTISSTPPTTSSSASATFTFTSSEAGSTFACSLDVNGFTPCASPQAYSGLGDGTHTFRVQAVDAAGNVDSTAAAYSWQIVGVGPGTTDRTPPGNVKRLKREVGYGILRLAWKRPPDADFDHVKIFVSTSPKSPPRTLVYKGAARAYTNKRFKNGLYYRYAVLSYDHAGNASRGAAAVVPPSILLRSPRDRAVVKSPPRLLWAPVPRASFYNVQLYSTNAKMLSAWPGRAKLTLSRRWTYAGRRFELKKGLYRWFVWPGFGSRAKGRYGQLLGQGTFRVS
jgi:hypothetical protein